MTVQETQLLEATLDDLKHLFEVTDRILVLYEGRLVADRRTSESVPREVVELIVGSARTMNSSPMMNGQLRQRWMRSVPGHSQTPAFLPSTSNSSE